MLPVNLIVYNNTEETKSEDFRSFKVVLDRQLPVRRQIQILLYQTYVFKDLDSLLLAGTDDDPVVSPND